MATGANLSLFLLSFGVGVLRAGNVVGGSHGVDSASGCETRVGHRRRGFVNCRRASEPPVDRDAAGHDGQLASRSRRAGGERCRNAAAPKSESISPSSSGGYAGRLQQFSGDGSGPYTYRPECDVRPLRPPLL